MCMYYLAAPFRVLAFSVRYLCLRETLQPLRTAVWHGGDILWLPGGFIFFFPKRQLKFGWARSNFPTSCVLHFMLARV